MAQPLAGTRLRRPSSRPGRSSPRPNHDELILNAPPASVTPACWPTVFPPRSPQILGSARVSWPSRPKASLAHRQRRGSENPRFPLRLAWTSGQGGSPHSGIYRGAENLFGKLITSEKKPLKERKTRWGWGGRIEFPEGLLISPIFLRPTAEIMQGEEKWRPRQSQQAEEMSQGRRKVIQMKFPRAQGTSVSRGRERGDTPVHPPAPWFPPRRRQEQARDIPRGLALMKTRTLRPAGTRWEAQEFPSRPPERRVPGQGSFGSPPRRLATSP